MKQTSLTIRETLPAGSPVKLHLDFRNKRIKVLEYPSQNIDHLDRYLATLGREKFGKIIVVAGMQDWQDFLNRGYQLEGVNAGYFLGQPGFYMVRYLTSERRTSRSLETEAETLKNVFTRPRASSPPILPDGYSLRNAVSADIPQIILLFKNIFASYPSPITNPGYLSQFLQNNIFQVISYGGRVVGTASAELDPQNLAAEMTDCACLTKHRGQGLMACLLYSLEQELTQKGFKNLYSIARASQPGINAVLWKLGYTYGGCFTNNCTIGGDLENMNLWVKNFWPTEDLR